MPFAIAGAAIGAGASIIGSSMQAGAVKDAQNSANAEQEKQLAQARNDLAPWRDTGQDALGVASNLSGVNGLDAAKAAQGNFLQSPGYDWQFNEGLRAVDAGAAAKGMLRSGATLKAETEFGQGLAKQDFATYYNRLYDLAHMGQASAAKSADASVETGKGIAQTDASAGSAQASIYGDTTKGLTDTTNKLFSNVAFQNGIKGFGASPSNPNPGGLAGNTTFGSLDGLGIY